MGDGGPLHIRAIHATMVPDSKKMDMAKWERDLRYSQRTAKHELRPVEVRSFDVTKRAQRSDDAILLRHMDEVVGTGPEEHLMSDFVHIMTSLCLTVCGGVAH